MIPELGALIEQVQKNCHIADARHARDMTLCTYLLEMREFYRWEHGIPHREAPPRADVSRWIAEREGLWEELYEEAYADLWLGGERFEPFDAESLNRLLLPAGLVYGAGIGRFGKPHFFLARLDRVENHDGLEVLVCDCEYARDLTALPAALQGTTVVVRREALRQWLGEKAETWDLKQGDGAMSRALKAYRYDSDPAAALEAMAHAEAESLILHERGEHRAGRILGPTWETMISGFTHRRAEILARAVRDNWADCLTTLPTLVERGALASLHFWQANFEGMRLALFPSLAAALDDWQASGDPAPILAAAARGREHWQSVALSLLPLAREQGEAALDALTHDLAPIAL
ncbi:MAG: hypothetical protein PHU46_00585 [Rhodocyclaceae bacterium]|nr:hypothetical protein [Rhodocyclaceae bacterium]